MNGQSRVIEDDALLACLMVDMIDFIGKDGRLAEHHIAVGKAAGHVELTFVFSGQFHIDMLTKGGRTLAHVHGHIQHAALNHTYQLGLGIGRRLKVQAPQRAALREGLIVLNELNAGHGFVKGGLIERFKEVAARVFEDPGFYEKNVGY